MAYPSRYVILNPEGARIPVTFCMGNFDTVFGQAISAGVFIGVGPWLCGLPRIPLLGTCVNRGKKIRGRSPFSLIAVCVGIDPLRLSSSSAFSDNGINLYGYSYEPPAALSVRG
jgi:hypothetical protein